MPSAITPPPTSTSPIRVTKFTNCQLVKNGRLVREDLWISARSGKILDRQSAFYGGHVTPDQTIDLGGKIVSPGFIDVQLNGAQGFDFSVAQDTPEAYEAGLRKVNQHLIRTGVTSYLPTVTSTRRDVYHRILPHLEPSGGLRDPKLGAESLGAHVEGPFLSSQKNGIHHTEVLRVAGSLEEVEEMYGKENLYPRPAKGTTTTSEETAGRQRLLPPRIKKITAAPELGAMTELIPSLARDGRIFSIGHTTATFEQGLHAVDAGATMITHLFNAMLPFGHRDPGLFGLLGNHSQTSSMPIIASPHSTLIPSRPSTPATASTPRSFKPLPPPASSTATTPNPSTPLRKTHTPALSPTPSPSRPFFGLIADGIHLHPTTLSLAHSSHPSGTILVTDSMPLTGLPDGVYPYLHEDDRILKSGAILTLEKNGRIAGSAVTLIECVNNFRRWTGVGVAEAVGCVTENVGRLLGCGGEGVPDREGGDGEDAAWELKKGRLEPGWDADLVILDEDEDEGELRVEMVWKFGVEVYRREETSVAASKMKKMMIGN